MPKSGKSATLATTFFLFSLFFSKVQLPIWRLINKSLWKDEKSYGGDTWYMDSTFVELKIRLSLANFHLHNNKGVFKFLISRPNNFHGSL